MGFLKAILIILLGYYLLKVLAKWFAPRVFGYAARQTEKHFREQFGQFQEQTNTNKDSIGDTIIDSNPKKKNSSSNNVGEYIDFEEIE